MVKYLLPLAFFLSVLVVVWWLPWWDDRVVRRSCPGCREGTVLFLDSAVDGELCDRHYRVRRRIAILERQMDQFEEGADG